METLATIGREFARMVTILISVLLILLAVKAPAEEPTSTSAGSLFDAMVRAEQTIKAAQQQTVLAAAKAKLAAEKRLADLKAKAEAELLAAAKSVEPDAVKIIDTWGAAKIKEQEILQSLSQAVEKIATPKQP